MRALGALAVAGFAFGLAALALVLTGDHDTTTGPFVVLALTLGWSFIGTGLYAMWRRPEQVIGRLMTVVGFLWFVGALPESDSALVYTVGLALGGLWAGPLVHLLIAFPTGVTAPGLERSLVRLGYTIPFLQPLLLLFVEQPTPDCRNCPDNLLLVADSPAIADLAMILLGVAGVAMLAGVCAVLVRRWRRSGPVQRRALAPVAWTGAAIAVVGVTGVIPQVAGADGVLEAMEIVLIVLITAVPFAFLVGLLRSTLSRAGALGDLVERVGTASVRDALAEALGDPQLSLAYWLPRPGGYVDADGRPVELPAPGSARAVTEIEHDGSRVAAIVHDAALREEPALVRAAGAAAALALRNERLDAELRARYEELRASRSRLVAAGDAARRRIERDLHDGAQQHLVSLALTLRLARSAAEPGSTTATLLDGAIDELKHGLAELRELARGIHPAVLTERGLEPALAGLAARAPVPVTVSAELDERLPPQMESAAYFLVSEALTNVAKYADATEAEVSVQLTDGHVVIAVRDDGIGGADPTAGSGLRGMADRVAALDGQLEVRSPRGAGTLVRAELPYRVRSLTPGAGLPTRAR
jgi:signal transduction histidine kinase